MPSSILPATLSLSGWRAGWISWQVLPRYPCLRSSEQMEFLANWSSMADYCAGILFEHRPCTEQCSCQNQVERNLSMNAWVLNFCSLSGLRRQQLFNCRPVRGANSCGGRVDVILTCVFVRPPIYKARKDIFLDAFLCR